MKLFKFISISIIAISLFSCEKNDPLADLGEVKGVAASVNMETQSTIIVAGKKITLPVVYWMAEGADFADLSLNQSNDSIVEMKLVKVAGIDFNYEHRFVGKVLEQEMYNKTQHSEGSWSNAYFGYRIKARYTIDRSLRIKRYSNTAAVVAYISTDMYNEMYEDFVLKMSNVQLEQILVTDNAAITKAEFDSSFNENGTLTTEGKAKLIEAFALVPKDVLVGTKPSVKRITQVNLQYFVNNSNNVIGKSNTVSFTVK